MKTAFSDNNNVYKQIDGVSMGSSLGPVLANIIMTELEKIMVSDLINFGLIKFYIRYADDTLLLAKEDDIDNIVHQKKSEALLTIIKAKNKKMLKRRCKIDHFLQDEENGNVLIGKRQRRNHSKAKIIYDTQCPACKEHYIGKTDQ